LHIVSRIGSTSSKIKALYGRIRATSISMLCIATSSTYADGQTEKHRPVSTHFDEQHANLDSPASDKQLMHALARLKLYFMMMRSERLGKNRATIHIPAHTLRGVSPIRPRRDLDGLYLSLLDLLLGHGDGEPPSSMNASTWSAFALFGSLKLPRNFPLLRSA
jgi:hypothetical protein